MSPVKQFSVTAKSVSHSYHHMQAMPEKISADTPADKKEVRTERESYKHLFITMPSVKNVESKPDVNLIDILSGIMILKKIMPRFSRLAPGVQERQLRIEKRFA